MGDHKSGGGYRPVLSGCSSDSLGLSGLLSDVVESLCQAVQDPFEVISSEDMLSRIQLCNKKIEKIRDEKQGEHGTDSSMVVGGGMNENNKEAKYIWDCRVFGNSKIFKSC